MKYISKNRDQIKSERTPFLKLYTDDWIAGTIELDFEEKGFYFEVLLRMWERKGTLPDDDKWLACALGCNPRTVRKLVTRLASTNHLQVANGIISNRRMMREISQHIAKSQPELAANSSPIRPEFDSNSTGTDGKTQAKSTTEKTLPEAIFHIPEPEEKKEKKAPSADIADQMIENILSWTTHSEATARQWLQSQVAAYGQDITARSYAKMMGEKLAGSIISKPIITWCNIANRMRDDASKPARGKRAPWVEDKAKRQNDTLKMAKEMGLI